MASHSQPLAQEFTRAIADVAAGTVPATAGEEQELVPSPSAGRGAASQPQRQWVTPPAPAAAAVVDAAEGSVPPVQKFAPTTSISKPKAVHNSKLKRKNIAIDLKTLWSRAGKKSRACAGALVNTSPIVEHVQVEQQVQVQNTSPSNQLHSTMSSPSVQNQQQLQIVGAMNTSPIAEPGIEHEASEESENIEEENDTEDAVYDVELLEPDPGKRIAIADYDVNDQNRIRRGYIAKGACRPKKYAFPQHPVGGMCRFVAKWFKSYKWLEYSKELDAAFCFVCYLFKDNSHVGGDCFVNVGFVAKWFKSY